MEERLFFFLSVGEVVCKSRYVNVQRVKNDLHTASVSHMLRVRVFSRLVSAFFFFFLKETMSEVQGFTS